MRHLAHRWFTPRFFVALAMTEATLPRTTKLSSGKDGQRWADLYHTRGDGQALGDLLVLLI